jgi:hypothetical protein
MNSLYLDGAQDVARAGQTIHSAASTMSSAAASIDNSMSRAAMSIDGSLAAMRLHMDDWINRLDAILASPPAAPEVPATSGKALTVVTARNSIADADGFEIVGVFDDVGKMTLAVRQFAERHPGRIVFSYFACMLNEPTEASRG